MLLPGFLLSTSQCSPKSILFTACLLDLLFYFFCSRYPLCSSKPFHFLLLCSIPSPSIPSVLFPFVTLFRTELLLNLTTLQLHPSGLSPAMTHGHTSSPLLFFPFLLFLTTHSRVQSPRLSWTWTSPCATKIGASLSA